MNSGVADEALSDACKKIAIDDHMGWPPAAKFYPSSMTLKERQGDYGVGRISFRCEGQVRPDSGKPMLEPIS
jgi:hypothetical protein